MYEWSILKSIHSFILDVLVGSDTMLVLQISNPSVEILSSQRERSVLSEEFGRTDRVMGVTCSMLAFQ